MALRVMKGENGEAAVLRDGELANGRKERPKSCVVGIVQSKFRHCETVLGSKTKSAFINLRNVNNRLPVESNGFCVSRKYAAVPFSGCAGFVAVFELVNPVKLPDGIIDGLQNRVQLTDLHWNPFRDDELAVGLENGSVNIWRIDQRVNCIGHLPPDVETPDASPSEEKDELKLSDLEPYKVLKVSNGSKVIHVRYHPTTNNLLTIALLSGSIQFWSLEGVEPYCVCKIESPTQAVVLSLAWSVDGRLLTTASRDGFIRIYQPTGCIEKNLIVERKILEITRAARVLFVCEDSLLLLVNFNKSSNRQCQLYRIDDLELVHSESIDTSTQPLVPHYDNDTSVLFLSGKGDRSVQMFEVAAESPHFMKLASFNGISGHQSIAYHQKNVCNVMDVEFQKGWRLSEKVLESISFRVPRIKKDLFQRDLFPNALVTWEPVNTIKEWSEGVFNLVKFQDLCPPNISETLNVARMATQKLATKPKADINGHSNELELKTELKMPKEDLELECAQSKILETELKSELKILETKATPNTEQKNIESKEEKSAQAANKNEDDGNRFSYAEELPLMNGLYTTNLKLQKSVEQSMSNLVPVGDLEEPLVQDLKEGVAQSEWTEE